MALEGVGSICFSFTQLARQKKAIINSAKKYIYFKGNCAILRIVFQPRALSYELPASRKGVYMFCNPPNNLSRRTHVDRSCIFLYGFLSRYVENCQPVFYLSLTGFCKKFFVVFLDPFSLNVRLFLVLVMGIH